MTKAELIVVVAEKTGETQKVVGEVLDSILDTITEILATTETNEKVVLTGFGTFEVRHRKERKGKNPRTGEEIIIPKQKTALFRVGKLLKDALKESQ